MKKFPKIFIIILNYNGKNCLPKTLSSVFKISYPNQEIVLVDNNSADGSFEAARNNFSKITFIKNSENLGFSAGNNVGIKYALERGADYVLLLNYDVEVESDFLEKLVEAMEKNKNTGIGNPVILESDKKIVWFSGGEINWLSMKTKHRKNNISQDYFWSDYISGCAMLIKAEVFKKIGLLDEKFFLYWEDADFSYRAKKAKYELLVSSQSRIVHFEKSEAKKENKIYWLIISGLIFFKKNTPVWLKPYIFSYIFLRKLKNKFDIKFRRNNLAEAVQKAYKDFKYAK